MQDNYDLFVQHEKKQQAELDKLPLCDCCEEPIQDYECYFIGNELLCEDCMNDSYRVYTDDFMNE